MNRIYRLASAHYLVVAHDTVCEVVPFAMDVSVVTVEEQVARLREIADQLEATDTRVTRLNAAQVARIRENAEQLEAADKRVTEAVQSRSKETP